MKQICYVGFRIARGGTRVVVEETDGSQVVAQKRLDPEPSRALWDHSPGGFEWGYGGSGPAQLALAILLDGAVRAGENPKRAAELAVRFHQDFKWKHVAKFEREGFRLRLEDVVAFLL